VAKCDSVEDEGEVRELERSANRLLGRLVLPELPEPAEPKGLRVKDVRKRRG
jgi:hypothetical protein